MVIYSLFLILFWESVNIECGAGASALGPSRSGPDPAAGSGRAQAVFGPISRGRRGRAPSLPPSRPCKAVKNSWKALGGGEGGQDPGAKQGMDGVYPWGAEGWGTGMARDRSAPSADTRWELTLPFGLLCYQLGFSTLALPHGTAAIPLPSPGSGLGSVFTSPCSAVPFASSTCGRGGFTAPEKRGLVLALQQLPLFLTWQCLRAPGAPSRASSAASACKGAAGATEDQPLLGVSLQSERPDEASCPKSTEWLPAGIAVLSSLLPVPSAQRISCSRRSCVLRARSQKAPGASIALLLALGSGAGAGLLCTLQIFDNWCGRRGREALGTLEQDSPAPTG